MTPVQCEFMHDPKNGVFGDCHRACIAAMLDLPIYEVPHFWHDGCSGEEFTRRVQEFLASWYLIQLDFYYVADPRPYMLANNPHVHWILGGSSRSKSNHSVVCLADQIVFDPNNVEIRGPMDLGYYGVSVIGVDTSGRRPSGYVPGSREPRISSQGKYHQGTLRVPRC